jgi:uncharacterized protein
MKQYLRFLLLLLLPLYAEAQTTDRVEAARKFLNHLREDEFREAYEMCDSTLREKMGHDVFVQAWNGLNLYMGEFQSVDSIWAESLGATQRVYQRCSFKRAKQDLILSFSRSGAVTGALFTHPLKPYQVPSYAKPGAYREEPVTICTGKHFQLPGLLTVPVNTSRFPVVVLVHGSGPGDRDESVPGTPNKVFRDLALGLAAKGIATLRYDKRTRVYPDDFGQGSSYTLREEYLDDVKSAVDLAARVPGADRKRIIVIGHSQGGMLAPLIAKENRRVSGVILMAGNARPVEDLLIEQYTYLGSTEGGKLSEEARAAIDSVTLMAERVKRLTSPSYPASLLPLSLPASYWMDLSRCRQVEVARSLRCNILVLQGEKDFQVTLTDLEIWKQALAGKKNVTFRSYPLLNHLFHEVEGRSTGRDYERPGNIPEYVISDIASWIQSH